MSQMVVPHRFRGPAKSGNGGWSAGALAELTVDADDHCEGLPPVTVLLRQPPPLDTVLDVVEEEGWTVAALSKVTSDGGQVARARVTEHRLAQVPPVPADQARAATARYRGLHAHPFPSCFTCGTGRESGDGLRVFPGPVAATPDGEPRVAATWTPHPSTAEDWWFLRSERSERLEGHLYQDDARHASLPVTWAALDCAGAWASDIEDRPMVLGTITVRTRTLPRIGDEHVLVGAERRTEGRKTFTAATMYDAAGAVVATAEHVWISIDPDAFN